MGLIEGALAPAGTRAHVSQPHPTLPPQRDHSPGRHGEQRPCATEEEWKGAWVCLSAAPAALPFLGYGANNLHPAGIARAESLTHSTLWMVDSYLSIRGDPWHWAGKGVGCYRAEGTEDAKAAGENYSGNGKWCKKWLELGCGGVRHQSKQGAGFRVLMCGRGGVGGVVKGYGGRGILSRRKGLGCLGMEVPDQGHRPSDAISRGSGGTAASPPQPRLPACTARRN